MLQAYVRAVVPADTSVHVPQDAVDTVHNELKKRELKIQGEIVAIMPLMQYV